MWCYKEKFAKGKYDTSTDVQAEKLTGKNKEAMT